MVKFTKRFERIPGVKKAVYIPNDLHLSIFYDKKIKEDIIKAKVIREIDKSNLERSVETLSFYGE